MGKTLALNAELRGAGSKVAGRVRREGRIPAVVYGHKQESVAVSVDAHDFVEGLHHGHRLLDVIVAGKKEKVIVKDIQYDHLGRSVIHADLMRVHVSERVRVTVPLELKGAAMAKGTHEGGIVEEHADHLEIECAAIAIPETIVVSVKDVGVGDALHAGDVVLPDGMKLVSPPEMLLVTCHLVAAAKTTEELEAEAPVAPEVIGEAKEGQQQGGAEEAGS